MTSTITHVDDLNTEGDDMQKVVLSDWWSAVGKMSIKRMVHKRLMARHTITMRKFT